MGRTDDANGDFEVFEDFEEFVDEDEHEAAAAYEGPAPRAEDEEHEPDVYDEYGYGRTSGEAFEQGEL